MIYFFLTLRYFSALKAMPTELCLLDQKSYCLPMLRKTKLTHLTFCVRNGTFQGCVPRLRTFSEQQLCAKNSQVRDEGITYHAQLGTTTWWHKEKAPVQNLYYYKSSKRNPRSTEKYSLTFYTRVHHGNLDPILAPEKRAERDSCLAYGDILGVSKDGAFYGNS